jgi:hypothetical protein
MREFALALSFYSTFVPGILGLFYFIQQPRDLKLLSVFFFITMSVEFFLFLIAKHKTNNVWLINLFMLFEGISFFYILSLWTNSVYFKRTLLIFFIVYFIVWIITTIVANTIFDHNAIEKILKCILLSFSSGYILIKYSTESITNIFKEYRFWILTGLLFYFSLTLIVHATGDLITVVNGRPAYLTWFIHSFVNAVTNIFFLIAYLCFFRKRKSYSLSR